jgi:hypothetical protein
VAEQVPDPDARRILCRIAPAAHLRHVGFGERVELKPALVAKLQDRQRGERLRHGGDPEQAVRGDDLILVLRSASERLHVSEAAVDDDAVDEAGHMLLRYVALEDPIERVAQCLNPLRDWGVGRCLRVSWRGGQQQSGDEKATHGQLLATAG